MALELYRRKDEPNLGQVGDIKHSILTEAQFQAIHGSTWTLMDGKSVVGTEYARITSVTTLPDARGQFLRAKNNGRADGQQDPTGERALGNQQADKMQGHIHYTGVYLIPSLYGSSGPNSTVGVTATGSAPSSNTSIAQSDSVNGTPRTGLETAPKNITVNIFVKIN